MLPVQAHFHMKMTQFSTYTWVHIVPCLIAVLLQYTGCARPYSQSFPSHAMLQCYLCCAAMTLDHFLGPYWLEWAVHVKSLAFLLCLVLFCNFSVLKPYQLEWDPNVTLVISTAIMLCKRKFQSINTLVLIIYCIHVATCTFSVVQLVCCEEGGALASHSQPKEIHTRMHGTCQKC
jgi:hypothetical protein